MARASGPMSQVAALLSCPYSKDMVTRREDAVRRAIELAPQSERALALAAGISPRLLSMIRHGERTATPRVVAALAEVLEATASDSADAGRILRESLTQEES